MALELSSGGETFRAIVTPATFIRYPSLRPGSELQLTGVVRSDSKFAGANAFALLLSPSEDAIRVVREPPWWTTGRIIAALLIAAVVVTILILAYQKFKERYLLQIMNERELLAHDLHDTVSQSLAGIGLQLASAESYVSGQDTARQQIERAREMVSQSHEELRRSVTTLRNQIAAIGDLAYALRQVAKRMIAEGGIQVDCTVSGVVRRIPVPVADSFFRIGQEAIANAVQHGNASRISISLTYLNRVLTMRISDNGSGFIPNQSFAGHGIFGMKKRAEMIGAKFDIIRESQGMTVSVDTRLSRSNRLLDSFVFAETQDK